MKKFLLIGFLAAIFFFVATPHTFAAWTNHGGSSGAGTWNSIVSSSDGTHLAAVGSGFVWVSADTGLTWTDFPNARGYGSSGFSDWYAVASDSTGSKLVAVSQTSTGCISISTDAGVTWSLHNCSSGVIYWGGVSSSSDGSHLAATDQRGYIWTSSDAGLTWTDFPDAHGIGSSGGNSWRKIVSDSTGRYLAASAWSGGGISVSNDYGAHWTVASSGIHASGSWAGIASDATGQYLAATDQYGYIWMSTNYGATWTDYSGSSGMHNWVDVASDASGNTLIAGSSGTYIYVSHDRGVHWTAETGAGIGNWYKTASDATGTKYAAANYGEFIYENTVVPPTVLTVSSSAITQTTATITGNITDTGGAGVSNSVGFSWGTSSLYGSTASAGIQISPGTFTANLTGLTCATGYHFEATAINSMGSAHGVDMSFTTSSCPPVSPTVLTVSATSITTSTVTLTGNLTDLGGAPSATAGFNYGTTTAYGSTVTMSAPYTVPTLFVNTTIASLTCNTLYHYRAWATNSIGTTNGADMTFTTSICLTPPLVTTDSVTPGSTSATFNGTIVSLGGASSASARGFSYNTTPTLTTIGLDPAIDSGVGTFSTGPYTLTITGLSCATSYHFRAYAQNTTGMGTGSDMSFTTLACSLVPPTVHTVTATVSGTTATLKGHLDSFGIGASGPSLHLRSHLISAVQLSLHQLQHSHRLPIFLVQQQSLVAPHIHILRQQQMQVGEQRLISPQSHSPHQPAQPPLQQ